MTDRGILTAIDANINRSIEGLRVCEDIFRFFMHHPLSAEIKEARHRIASLASSLSPGDILYFRDVDADAQKFIDTPGEMSRGNVSGVFRSNIRRAAEALRSLEEFSKMVDSSVSGEFQKLRFTIYNIEQRGWGLLQKSLFMEKFRNSLYAVIDSSFVGSDRILDTANVLADSGVGIIGLHMKNASDREYLNHAEAVASVCRGRDIIFIVKGRGDIALLSGADGVHLGRSDIPVLKIDGMNGGRLLKGVSVRGEDEAEGALKGGADYLAIGPVYDTTSGDGKQLQGIGMDVVRRVCSLSDRPVIATGGIKKGDVKSLLEAGISGIAVGQELYSSGDIAGNALSFAEAVKMCGKTI